MADPCYLLTIKLIDGVLKNKNALYWFANDNLSERIKLIICCLGALLCWFTVRRYVQTKSSSRHNCISLCGQHHIHDNSFSIVFHLFNFYHFLVFIIYLVHNTMHTSTYEGVLSMQHHISLSERFLSFKSIIMLLCKTQMYLLIFKTQNEEYWKIRKVYYMTYYMHFP